MEWLREDETSIKKASLIELVERPHVEGYEDARRHVDAVAETGVCQKDGPLGFWRGSEIEALIRLCRKEVDKAA